MQPSTYVVLSLLLLLPSNEALAMIDPPNQPTPAFFSETLIKSVADLRFIHDEFPSLIYWTELRDRLNGKILTKGKYARSNQNASTGIYLEYTWFNDVVSSKFGDKLIASLDIRVDVNAQCTSFKEATMELSRQFPVQSGYIEPTVLSFLVSKDNGIETDMVLGKWDGRPECVSLLSVRKFFN